MIASHTKIFRLLHYKLPYKKLNMTMYKLKTVLYMSLCYGLKLMRRSRHLDPT